MDRSYLDRLAQTPDDRVLLSRLWDKLTAGMQRNIPAATCFLSLREQALARALFGKEAGLVFWGGYPGAERKMLCYLPEYLDEASLLSDGPVLCLKAGFYKGDTPSHRDFLGALMGAGIARECVGDILVSEGACLIFVTAELAPYLLQNFESAGRTALKLECAELQSISLPEEKTEELRDTVPSLRLDCVLSAGFRISRTAASQAILAGKTAIDGLPCEKPDKPVSEGATLSVRGLGKIRLKTVSGRSKKDRIFIVIDKFV